MKRVIICSILCLWSALACAQAVDAAKMMSAQTDAIITGLMCEKTTSRASVVFAHTLIVSQMRAVGLNIEDANKRYYELERIAKAAPIVKPAIVQFEQNYSYLERLQVCDQKMNSTADAMRNLTLTLAK